MPFSRSFAFLCAAVLFVVTQACAPAMQVTRLAPAYYNLGATKRVAVLEVNGEGRAVAQVIAALQQHILNDGYYSLVVATNRGAAFTVSTPGGMIEIGEVRRLVDADVYVNANVTRYDYLETESDEKNGDKEVHRYQPESHVRINFQVVKNDGRVIVFRDYDGNVSGTKYDAGKKPSRTRSALLESAVQCAVNSFTYDITPRRVTERIVFDDDDDSLKPGIKMAENGDLGGAERAFSALLSSNPNNAGAIYNMGVLLETRGEFEQAGQAYNQAITLLGKGLYKDALENMNRRIAEAQSLSNGI